MSDKITYIKKNVLPKVGSRFGGMTVTKIKHGRKQNKGTHTLTICPKK